MSETKLIGRAKDAEANKRFANEIDEVMNQSVGAGKRGMTRHLHN